MIKPKRRLRRFLFLLLGLVSWLIGIVLVLWLTLPRWLPSVIAHYTAPMEIDMNIREIGLHHSFVENIEVKIDQIELRVPDVSISYSPSGLMAGRAETIMLNNASLDLSLAAGTSENHKKETGNIAPPDLESIFNAPLPELPLDELLIDNFTLNLVPESGKPVSSNLNLQAIRSGSRWDAKADLTLHNSRLDLIAYQSADEGETRGFELAFEIPDPIGLLNENASLFPEASRQQIEAIPFAVSGFSGMLDWKHIDKRINLQALAEHLAFADVTEADKVFLDATSPNYLESVKATLLIQQLNFPAFGSVHLEAEINVAGAMTGNPNLEADLTITDPLLAEALPVTVAPKQKQMPKLQSHLRWAQNEDPIQGLESNSRLNIPASTVIFTLSPERVLNIEIVGQIQLEQIAEQADIGTNLQFENIRFQDTSGLELTAALECDLNTRIPDLLSLQEFDPFKNLEATNLTGKFHLKGKWLDTVFSASNALLEIQQEAEDEEVGFTGHLQVENATWDIWELLQADIKARVLAETAKATVVGNLLNSSLSASIEYQTDYSEGTQQGIIKVFTTPESGKSRVKLQKLDQTMPETVAEGMLQARVSVAGTYQAPEMDLSLKLEDGSLSMPGSKVSVSGIQLPQITIDNLLTGGGPTRQEIHIGAIDFPPNQISDVHIVFDPLEGFGVNIRKLTFRFCGGLFEIDFSEPIVESYDAFAFDLKFTGVDIQQLTQLIPDFKDEIEGKIEGHIPVSLKDGRITWQEGHAKLVNGTTCIMRYSKTGLVATYIPKIEISKKLDIDVNEALRDITLTRLDIKLRASDQFSQPSVVIMSGHSNNPKIEIPIEKIQLNIRAGDIPSILNETLQQSKWFEWLTFKKEK